jgi:hypothetical protein
VKKKKPYTLGVITNGVGSVETATLNNNPTREAKVIKPDALPSYVLERIALLKVKDDPSDPVVKDVGRKLVSNCFTIYLNLDEYKQIRALPSA